MNQKEREDEKTPEFVLAIFLPFFFVGPLPKLNEIFLSLFFKGTQRKEINPF